MSEFKVEVSRVSGVVKHPNADTLSIADINGYPVIFRTGDYEEGQLAVYVPVDSVVPDLPEWAFLSGHRRIKAKRLRGVFSMGLLSKALPEWTLGQDVQAEMGIEKWEPEMALNMNTENERDPGFLPVFTDIEGLRRHKTVLVPGEEVVITEKIHGANARFVYRDGALWVGSHKNIKRRDETNMWWRLAIALGLEEKLAQIPGTAIYGEVYGQVQDLKYGIPSGTKLILFDALDTNTRTYCNYDEFRRVASLLGLPTVPELYRGPWSMDLASHAEGKTTVVGADHVREGFVVRPIAERWDHKCGRVILKMIGEGYLLRKGA
jgi:RNA ligase (TIGR02306 family)